MPLSNKSAMMRAVRMIYCSAVDMLDLLSGRRDELMPPRRIRYLTGAGDFRQIGEDFLRYFTELGGLQPDERVLDVGCGVGRMAIPLTKYLNKRGRYEGFDIIKEGIDWCQEKITPRFPNFSFQLVDIYNKRYNPEGRHKASRYKFPYEDESFDFVFLTSVFTHMLPEDVENYFSEIARVLRNEGRCLITYFLLNQESLELMNAKSSLLDFQHTFEGYRTVDKNEHESAVAYDETYVRALCGKYGLRVEEPIRFGSWCGRKSFLSFQDIIIAVKK